jgi:hypothetical protein
LSRRRSANKPPQSVHKNAAAAMITSNTVLYCGPRF